MYENIIRYIENAKSLSLSTKKYIEMNNILTESGYKKINLEKMLNPGFIPTAELQFNIFENNSKYDYLLNISDRKKSAESLEKYKTELSKCLNELETLNINASKGNFIGAQIWLDELDNLEKVIINGQQTFWRYEDTNLYTHI